MIDNGQYEMKYCQIGGPIRQVPNCIIRTSNDKRLHPGLDLLSTSRLAHFSTLSGLTYHRPISSSQVYQWNLEHEIWDHAFMHYGDDSGNGEFMKDANVLYMGSVVTLPKFQNMIDEVLFEEYQIGQYVRSSASQMVPWLSEVGDNDATSSSEEIAYKPFQLVVDIGFDCTWVVPMIHGLPYYKGIKRMPIGGRMLNGYLREVISFRHYNVVEEPVLIDSIKRNVCYVAEDYDATLSKLTKLKKTSGRALLESDISINYLLPDNKNDFFGKPIPKNQRVNEEDGQSILLTDERFLIPEMLFHPQLAGVYKSGLISTIKESLMAVPELMRPLLANNVVCIGGTSNLPGLRERILKDLDKEVPVEAKVRLCQYDEEGDKQFTGLRAGTAFFEKGGFEQVKMTAEEYREFGCEYAYEKFGQYNFKS